MTSTQVTVTLPDEIYRCAQYLANLTGRDIGDILAETIQASLQPLGLQRAGDRPIVDLLDAEVLALAEGQMDPLQERRFSTLLARQQAGRLADEDHHALLAVMQVYQAGLLRKAQALHEAVHRDLHPPLVP